MVGPNFKARVRTDQVPIADERRDGIVLVGAEGADHAQHAKAAKSTPKARTKPFTAPTCHGSSVMPAPPFVSSTHARRLSRACLPRVLISTS